MFVVAVYKDVDSCDDSEGGAIFTTRYISLPRSISTDFYEAQRRVWLLCRRTVPGSRSGGRSMKRDRGTSYPMESTSSFFAPTEFEKLP